ncbi:MAG TPA: phosphatidate cytidylyltransferase [Longimicrobium sp.]|nr:phosphatidate cytidylyltransferase [Longimicrobium sp.]
MNGTQPRLSHLRVVGDLEVRNARAAGGPDELPRRLVVAAIGIPTALAVVDAGGWLLAGAAAALAGGGCLEICRLARRREVRPFTVAACAAAAAFPLIAAARPALEAAAPWMWALTLLLLMGSAVAAVWRRSTYGQPLEVVAVTVMAAVFTGGTLAFSLFLRHLPVRPDHYAGVASLALFPLALAWTGDTAAYAAGRTFGRRRLTRVSPAKTWEGAAAGLVATTAAGWVYATVVLPPGAGFPGWLGALAGALVSLAGLGADLAKSAWKREAGVKDSGRVFPGHGGILDRMDSTLYALPVVYVLAAIASAVMNRLTMFE